MKKNWMQIITLCLCGVLLVVTIAQGRQLSEFQRKMENQMDHLRSDVEHEIQYISNDIERELEEANRVVAEYALEPKGIDKENRSLQAEASVTLKEWYEDTQIVLLARVGNEELSLPTTADGNGTFSSQLSLPLEGNYEVFLDALVTGGGLTKKETLSAWGEISMMLPLRNSGGGWSGPEYREGVMSSQFNITIEGQDAVPGPIQNPQFLTYKNGELVLTQDAVEDPYTSGTNAVCYTVDTENYDWSVACEVGDVIEVRFRCEDEFGLGYDFLFQTWVAEGETANNQASAGGQDGSVPLELYWPG